MPTPSVAREYDAVGSITAAAKPMAAAASKALPPLSNMRMPAMDVK
jgi:hypothetical protein